MHEKTKMQRTLQTWLRHTIIRNNKILPNEYFRNKIKCNRSKIDIIDEHTCFADRVYILPLFWVVPIQEIHNRAFRAETLLMHSYNHQCRKLLLGKCKVLHKYHESQAAWVQVHKIPARWNSTNGAKRDQYPLKTR